MQNQKILQALTVARVRSGVVAALVCAATDLDSTLREKLPQGRYSVTLAGSTGIRRRLVFDSGRAHESGNGVSSVLLRFAGAGAMARALGGGKGTVIPLPLSPFFLKAVKGFVTSSGRVGELTAQREFKSGSEKAVVTEMLMTAALRGVAETALADPWTAPRSAHMPDGLVEFSIENTDISGWLQRDGDIWCSGRGKPPAKVNARLAFADLDTAFGLFTGTVAALNALGRGRISIRGRITMIRVLFPLLDRFGEIMQWGKDGES